MAVYLKLLICIMSQVTELEEYIQIYVNKGFYHYICRLHLVG